MNIIGKGGSSKVFLSKDRSGHKVVLKVLRKDKKYTRHAAEEMLNREHYLLQKLHTHPNIIDSYGVNVNGVATLNGEDEDIMYSMLEYAEHGSISNFVRYTGCIEESIAKFFMLQICHAVEFIHQEGYAHLDIKLENILLDSFFNIKLADMGASIYVADSEGWANKRRGTTLYMAPEVLNKSSGTVYNAYKADIFSLGISLFVLLVGEFPSLQGLRDISSTEETERNLGNLPEWEADLETQRKFKKLSSGLQDLIKSMTDIDPDKRPSISEIIQNSWFSEDFSGEFHEEVYLEMQNRKEFMLKSSFKHN